MRLFQGDNSTRDQGSAMKEKLLTLYFRNLTQKSLKNLMGHKFMRFHQNFSYKYQHLRLHVINCNDDQPIRKKITYKMN